MVRYVAEFVVGANAPGWARRFDARYVPINLFDTIYVAFERVPTSAALRGCGESTATNS
jgi:hypothetical protein